MKANRRARGRDEAVSSVVSAVLLFALFATLATLYTVNTLPRWVADNEAEHARSAKQAMDALKASVDASAATGSTSSVSAVFDLAPDEVPLIQPARLPGGLRLGPGLEVQASFTGASVYLAGGQLAAQPTCSVGAAASTACPALTDLASLRGMIVALTTSGVNGANPAAGVTVTFTDAGGQTVTLALQHASTGATPSLGCGGQHLRATLTTAAATTRHSLVQCGLDAAIPTGYQYDVLESANGLRAALGGLALPLDVSLAVSSSGGASASATFAAAWVGDDGLDRVAGTGLAQSAALDEESHVLSFDTNSQERPSETLSYQGGAVVRRQADGQSIVTDPAFTLAVAGGQGYLSWTLPVLEASGSASGGQGGATLTPLGNDDILLTAQGATVTLTSDEAAAWQAFFRSQRLAAGVGAWTGVAGDDTTAILSLDSSIRWTVRITVVRASALVS